MGCRHTLLYFDVDEMYKTATSLSHEITANNDFSVKSLDLNFMAYMSGSTNFMVKIILYKKTYLLKIIDVKKFSAML